MRIVVQRLFIAHFDGGQLVRARRHDLPVFHVRQDGFSRLLHAELIQRDPVAARAEGFRNHGVIAEVRMVQFSVFKAKQPERGHQLRIKLHLRFHILGDDVDQRGIFIPDAFGHIADAVDDAVNPVAVLAQHLQLVVLQIGQADAEHAEKQIAFLLLFDQLLQTALADDAEVQISVGDQDDLIVAPGDIIPAPDFIRALDPRGAVRIAVDLQSEQLLQNLQLALIAVDPQSFQHHAVPWPVGDEAEDASRLQLADHRRDRGLGVCRMPVHASRDVQQ